jgi:hypothetical protein
VLAVERVVACWFQLYYHTAAMAAAVEAGEAPRLLQYRSRWQAEAQKMYHGALTELATIQKLVPTPRPTSTGPSPDEVTPVPVAGPSSVGWEAEIAGNLPNRLESFFQNGGVKSRPAGAATAGNAAN